jgi:RNA polymerase sigma-70 factor (ECF subfamily)
MAGGPPHERSEEFEEAALPHVNALFNLALNLTRNRKDAEDLVQETYLRAFRFFDSYQPGTHIKAWLFRILRNTFINRYRAARVRPEEVDFDVEQAMAALPEEYRSVVIMALVEELSYKEIAAALSIPLGTVMSRLHRGRKQLQVALMEYAQRRGIIRPAADVPRDGGQEA